MESRSDRKYLFTSIALHAGLILFMTVKVYFFPMERPEFIKSVRVDIVAMPEKDPEEGPIGVEKTPTEEVSPTAPEKKAQEAAPQELAKPEIAEKKEKKAKKEDPKKEAKTDSKKSQTKDLQNSSLKRLEALAKIKKMKEAQKEGPEGKAYKGNQVSAGNSLTGVEKLQHDQYQALLNQHIKKNWQLPEWLSEKDLSAVVFIRYDEAGNLLDKRLIRSSGNVTFDEGAMQSIVASLPLPPPPANFVSYFKEHGIKIGFP